MHIPFFLLNLGWQINTWKIERNSQCCVCGLVIGIWIVSYLHIIRWYAEHLDIDFRTATQMQEYALILIFETAYLLFLCILLVMNICVARAQIKKIKSYLSQNSVVDGPLQPRVTAHYKIRMLTHVMSATACFYSLCVLCQLVAITLLSQTDIVGLIRFEAATAFL